MMKHYWPMSAIILLMIFYAVTQHFGMYLNTSDSMPKGIYRTLSIKAAVGQLATSCLTSKIANYGLQQGYFIKGACKNTFIQPVMKKILAVEGDKVDIVNGKLAINGQIYQHYPVAEFDSHHRHLERFVETPYNIPKDHYLLLSDHVSNSWDSRYFGPVKIDRIVMPVWILK